MRNLKTNEGITLLALVITIIVLLILSAISIATLTGENGLLTKANTAKEQTEIGEEKEKAELSAVGALAKDNGGEIKRNYLNDELTNNIGTEGKDYTLSESETAPFLVTYLDSKRSYLIGENGNISEYVDISKHVKVGQYVAYNPIISDKKGTQVEANKLTYTSPTGSGTEHGNGYTSAEEDGGQKFTATESIKWKVLDIGTGTVTLIPAEPIKKDEISQDNGNFVMKGVIGYLYAERELNEICKIFGYGHGADTSQVTKYSYGGPKDGQLTGKITGSGARSITIEDINKKAGIYEDKTDGQMKDSDGTVINSSYGSTTNPPVNIYYPTGNGEDATGKSTSAGVKNLKNTFYNYTPKIENTDVQNMLFNNAYWLASRCVYAGNVGASFRVRRVLLKYVSALTLCNGFSSSLDDNNGLDKNSTVCPVVTLKSDVIDINTNYDSENGWKLK